MANSYNELIGIGSHSEDANMEGHWPMQDDAASTAVDDISSNNRNGTADANTSTLTTTGPNGYLTASLDFNGATNGNRVDIGAADWLDSLSALTVLGWLNSDDATQSDKTFCSDWASNGDGHILFRVDAREFELFLNTTAQVGGIIGGSGDNYIASTTWYSFAGRYNGSEHAAFLDAVSKGTRSDTGSLTSTNTNNLWFGGTPHDSVDHFDGKLAGFAIFSRTVTDAEISQFHAGPELNYSSGVSFGSDGAFNIGTWALPSPFASGSNGTQTQEVLAAKADGTVLDTATTATGTLDLSANAGNTCYLLARVSNTGGYDIGDKATRTSAYGSTDDGYYELANVVAAAGGGGAFPFRRYYQTGMSM